MTVRELEKVGAGLVVVGRSVPQVDARERVTGEAIYTTDIKLPGMLIGRVKRSPHPHARILHIDVGRAERLPGVKSVITCRDTPGIRFGQMIDDWYILAKDRALFVGDEVAAVAAIDEDTAEEALDLIDVAYEPLPAALTVEEALRSGAPQVNERSADNVCSRVHVAQGDVEAALRRADLVVEDRFDCHMVHQGYMEPFGGVAQWGADGVVTFWIGVHSAVIVGRTYARALGIPQGRIRIIRPYIGGTFGAKYETNIHLIAALLSRKGGGRPVKIVLSREEDFQASNPRVPMLIDMKVGFLRDGTITAKDARIVANTGARSSLSPALVAVAAYRVDNLYRFQHVRAEGTLVYTHTIPTSCMRGFANSEALFALESLLDVAAERLGIDPAELRLRNAVRSGDVTLHGWEITTSGLEECIRRATEASGWAEKRARKRPYRGVGLACCNHVSGNRSIYADFDGASAEIRVTKDGRVALLTGECDVGQGQNTVFAQMAAEELGVPLADISLVPFDSLVSPVGLGSFATRGTVMGGHAVRLAAADAKQKLLGAAAELLDTHPEDLAIKDGRVLRQDDPERFVTVAEAATRYAMRHGGGALIGQGQYTPPTVMADAKKYGNISPVYPFAAHVAEVEVDPETGHVWVVDYWAAHDIGRVINPGTAEGQVHGGVTQGIAFALMEHLLLKDGRVQNPNFMDYRMPGGKDFPRDIHVIFVETEDPKGPLGAKGLGEPPINPVAAAIANAIYDAAGVRLTALPFTPERVLAALEAKG